MMVSQFALIASAHAAEAEDVAHGEGGLFTAMATDPKWFVFYGLVLFLVLVWRAGGFKAITGALDARAARIKSELAEAERLRAEAKALFDEYKMKRMSAEAEARAILAQARADAEALRFQARQELDAELQRRERLTEERIARAEQQAVAEVRSLAAEAAVEAAERLLRAELTPARQNALVREGAADLAARFA